MQLSHDELIFIRSCMDQIADIHDDGEISPKALNMCQRIDSEIVRRANDYAKTMKLLDSLDRATGSPTLKGVILGDMTAEIACERAAVIIRSSTQQG